MKKIEVVVFAVLISFILMALLPSFVYDNTIGENLIRLHIRADSDLANAQEVKLMVRDEILKETRLITEGAQSKEEALGRINDNLLKYQEVADRVLFEAGTDYRADVLVNEEFFTTRDYGSVTIPAGKYTTLAIELGKGEGKNWWCVMFPPLCYQGEDAEISQEAAAYFSKNLSARDYQLINSTQTNKRVFKFKVIEIYEKLKNG